jgi:hypothetical protein
MQTISLAFERVCVSLGLNMQDDPATRLVAEKIDRGVGKMRYLRRRNSSQFDSSGIR